MERQSAGAIRQLWRRWFGKPFTEKEHTEETDDIIERLGRIWARKVQTTGAKLVVAVNTYANGARLESTYLPYVFFILERPKRWPAMSSKSKSALKYAVDVMMSEHDTPPYRGLVTIPVDKDEKLVDRILTGVADWASNQLRDIARAEYKDVLSKFVGQVERERPAMRGSKAYIYLSTLLEHDLVTHPEFFRDPNLLWAAFDFLDI